MVRSSDVLQEFFSLHPGHAHASPYAGQPTRDIKALAQEGIEELLRGRGWRFARAAEPNGMLGPTYVLDVAAYFGLSAEQTVKVTDVRDEIRASAVTLGESFLAKEAQREKKFSAATYRVRKWNGRLRGYR